MTEYDGGPGDKPGPSSFDPRPSLPSLRIELLATFALLAAAALTVAIVFVVFFQELVDDRYGAVYLGALIVADVAVFVGFGAHQLRHLVNRPLDAVIEATEAISSGDLARRVPVGASDEFARLATSINRMTDRLLEEQTQRVRAEKLATVGRLAAGIAHEIGNPLGAINGYAHILRGRTNDPVAKESVDGLERESARIDRIVRGLLDYARPRRLTPSCVDVNDTMRSVLGLLRDQGALRRIELRETIDASSLELFGERHELEQVFVNVLLNAVNAMEGSGTIAVRTRIAPADELARVLRRRAEDPADVQQPRVPDERIARWLARIGRPDQVIQVVVADSGPGVPAGDAERIFDPFYTTKAPGKGTGLGLAIVARVVENLNGMVWVQPAREGGAAFVLVFPALNEEHAVAGSKPA